jgi:hypothetical protein
MVFGIDIFADVLIDIGKTHYKRSDGKDFNNLLGKFFFETGDPQPL